MLKSKSNGMPLSATTSGPKPGNFAPGSIQSRAAAKMLLNKHDDAQRREYEAELTNLTPLELATSEGAEDMRVKIGIVKLVRIAEARAKIFGLTLPTPEQVRYNRKIANAVDELSDGQGGYLQMADAVEWNRLKRIVEDKINAEGQTTADK
jgi:hypothetical protein